MAVAVGSTVGACVGGKDVSVGSLVGVSVGMAVVVGWGVCVLVETAVANSTTSSGLLVLAQAEISHVNMIMSTILYFFMVFTRLSFVISLIENFEALFCYLIIVGR